MPNRLTWLTSGYKGTHKMRYCGEEWSRSAKWTLPLRASSCTIKDHFAVLRQKLQVGQCRVIGEMEWFA